VLGFRWLGWGSQVWCRAESFFQKARPGNAAGPAARSMGRVMLCVAAPSPGSRSQNPVYAARNRLASLRAIFHIKSDSAMFDNIAVLSGSRSLDRVLAACGIGPFSSGWHTTKSAQETCRAIVVIKTRRLFSRSKRPVNFYDASFERLRRRPRRSDHLAKSAKGRSADEPPMSTNL